MMVTALPTTAACVRTPTAQKSWGGGGGMWAKDAKGELIHVFTAAYLCLWMYSDMPRGASPTGATITSPRTL